MDAVQSSSPTVLVIDDDPAIRDLLGDVLADAGYAVERTTGGHEALARLETGGIDLLLVDLKMPQTDGLEVCRLVRAREQANGAPSRLPIIVLTALSDDRLADTCNLAGADDYLAKPFDLDDLLGRVDRRLSGRTLTNAPSRVLLSDRQS